MPSLFRKGPSWGVLAALFLFLAACGPEAWERDPQVQTAKKACKGLDEGPQYDCIERLAVESLNPDLCRLAGIWIDDMCLQAVYEAADDPAICEQLYLEGVRPTCRAYYQRPPADWSVDAVLSVAGEPGRQTISAEVVVTHQGNHPVEDLDAWLVFPQAEGLPAEVGLTTTESGPPGPLQPNHARTYATQIDWQTGLAKEEISAILDRAQLRLSWTVGGQPQEGFFPLITREASRALPTGAGIDTAEEPPEPAPSPSPVATARLEHSTAASPTSARVGAPTWRHTLFVYNHEGATELWAMDVANGEAQQQIRPEQTVQDPALSPSGEVIAYIRVTGDYGGVVSELWLMDRDGGYPHALYGPPADQSLLSRPAWSPDGQEVYFLQQGSGTDSQLRRIPAHGGEPATILTGCLDFALSPDGQWLVSVSRGRELTISGRDGTRFRDLEPQGIAFSDTYSLAVSPDGELLALRATEAGGEDTWNLYVMDWSGRDVRRLTGLRGFHPPTSSTGQVNGLAWTADGAHLVYSVDGHQSQSGIWRIGLDGGEPRRLFAWNEGEWAAVRGPWSEIGSLSLNLTEQEAEALLRDYSQALSSGQISHQAFYSPAMQDLIVERRAYYEEFHQVALHSDLLGIDSSYELRSVTPDAVEEGLYHVRAVEWVTLRGRYRQPTPEEYTPARAALWALARTDHPAVRGALQGHLQREMANYLAGLYIEDSYQMDWIVSHRLLVQEVAERFTIVQDTFDDRANDNPEGTDVVEWVDGWFVRRKPDLTLSPDYAIFHEPVETVERLGQDLLLSYTRTYGGTPAPDLHPGWLTYTQASYGFSFRYPPGWDVMSRPDIPNMIWLRHRGQPGLELSIGFRWPDEEAAIQRTGVGAGQVETEGTVQFLGRELSRDLLSYEGKVKALLYNNAREIDVDGLIFTLSLDDRGRDYGAVELAPETQALLDEILSTFLLLSE